MKTKRNSELQLASAQGWKQKEVWWWRLSKEIESYLKEEKSETEQIEQMRESKADEYDIKQLVTVNWSMKCRKMY
mgnify:CR=1 FL=1